MLRIKYANPKHNISIVAKYKNIPPLRAIKAFEASARYLSFTKAANKLHVTQAAISHQIKNLEEMTGVALFVRQNRSLRLTNEGEIYLISIRNALESIETATRQLSSQAAGGTLNVSVFPSFATKWLSKRLWRFEQEHQGLDLRISAVEQLTGLIMNHCDIAIRYTADPNYPDLQAELFLEEEVFPVCSRQLYDSLGDLQPQDLLRANLLHEDLTTEDWYDWFTAAGVSVPGSHLSGTRFSHIVTMLESLNNNRGFALGRTTLVQDDLNRGVLVEPFNIRLKSNMAYYLVYPKSHEQDQKLQSIRRWLFKEAEQFLAEQKC